jgi:hypothetical protein
MFADFPKPAWCSHKRILKSSILSVLESGLKLFEEIFDKLSAPAAVGNLFIYGCFQHSETGL